MAGTSIEAQAEINEKIDKLSYLSSVDNNTVGEVRVRFIAKQPKYSITASPIHTPTNVKRSELSEVINRLLNNDHPVHFEFILTNNVIKGTLASHILKYNLNTENVLEIEYTARGPTFTKQTVCEYQDWVSGISLSKNNNLVFTSSFGGDISIWNHSAEFLSGSPKNCQLNTIINLPIDGSDDHYIVTGTENFNINLDKYTYTSNQITPVFSGKLHSPIVVLEPHVNNTMFFSGCFDGTIQLFDILLSRDDLRHEKTPYSSHSSLDINSSSLNDESFPVYRHTSKTHKSVMSSSDISINSEVSNSISPILSLPKKHTAGVTSIKVISNYTFSSSYDSHIIQWDINKNTYIHTIDTSNSILCMDSSPSLNGVLASGHSNNRISIQDVRSTSNALSIHDPIAKHPGTTAHSSWVSQIKWAPLNNQFNPYFFASASYDGTVKIWDIRTLSPVSTLVAAPKLSKLFALDWCANPSMILVGGQNCKLKFFQ